MFLDGFQDAQQRTRPAAMTRDDFFYEGEVFRRIVHNNILGS
jgi:hypothetical protein